MRILILGAGDLSSGIALRLRHSGHDIIMTEIKMPTCVRRTVSFAEAVYEGTHTIEDVTAEFISNTAAPTNIHPGSDVPNAVSSAAPSLASDIDRILSDGNIAVIADEKSQAARLIKPDILIDARMAKINLGTTINDAPFVIGIGPGFTAGRDCHAVIETMRGHTLGRVIYEGSAIPNTGIPGNVGGYTTERLVRATADGIFHPVRSIGDHVKKDEKVAYVESYDGSLHDVCSNLDGILRGILHDGVRVKEGLKSGDVDARCEKEYCYTVSDKALSVAGGVLEAVCTYLNTHNK